MKGEITRWLKYMNFNFLSWRRRWQPTPALLPGKSHGQRSLEGYSPWGREESDTAEWLHFSLSCIGEGNGNPLQYSCLENPRDRGAWWAAIYGVTQNRTPLKRLSSSSSSNPHNRSQFYSLKVWPLTPNWGPSDHFHLDIIATPLSQPIQIWISFLSKPVFIFN